MTTDRPATEPRTPTGRAYLAELNGEKEPPEEWRDARGYLPRASRRAWEHDRDMILAIEAEAGSPAALTIEVERPLDAWDAGYAEGRAASPAALDVERLAEIMWDTSNAGAETPWVDLPSTSVRRSDMLGWAQAVVREYARLTAEQEERP